MSASEPSTGDRSAEKVQRIRVRFSRGATGAGIGHLDVSRRWEDAFRAAGIGVSYSQGNRPQPRITIAAGLASGVTSEGELLDVVLAELTDPARLVERVQPFLPDGLAAIDAWEVGLGLPSLPTLVRWADYEVDLRIDDVGALRAQVAALLARESFSWVDVRGEKRREYDLRALVQELRVEPLCEGTARLSMRLRSDSMGVGRPDQVVKALGLPEPVRTHRLRLVVPETSPARDAWRRRGRFIE
jgi:radical SAM-linked protein